MTLLVVAALLLWARRRARGKREKYRPSGWS